MKIRTSLLPLAILVLLLLGCNGDDAAPADGPLTIEADEFEFDPASVTIAADTDVQVTLENVGAVEHDWEIEELGINIYADAGQTTTETINIPAGTYDVICTIPGHAEAGMVGTLTAE